MLAVGTRLDAGAQLEVGAVTESVTVTAQAPLLDTSAISAGRVVDNRSVMDLPTPSNNPMVLGRLAPSMQTDRTAYDPAHAFGASSYYLPGKVGSNDYAIDGLANLGPNRVAAFNPYSDTVQEFKIETSNFDASVGNNAGAGISMLTKTGTNGLHGTLTEQHWQARLNGTSFFVRQLYYSRSRRPRLPVTAPWQRAYAARISSHPAIPTSTPPRRVARYTSPRCSTAVTSCSSFSASMAIANRSRSRRMPSTIPSPRPRICKATSPNCCEWMRCATRSTTRLSVRADPARATHYIRDAFPGNLIPRSRFQNPMYGFYSKLIPKPNNSPAAANLEPLNNYLSVGAPLMRFYDAYTNRIDYNRSEKHRFFARWSWSHFLRTRGDWTYETVPNTETDGLFRQNAGATVDWVYTHSAATLFNFTFGLNQYHEGSVYGARL